MKLNIAVACGILANIQVESRFNHLAVGDSGAAFGLFQWRGSRRISFERYCDSGRERLSPEAVLSQLAFMHYELRSTEKRTLTALQDIQETPQGAYDAGDIFCREFERPSGKEAQGKFRGELARDTYWQHYSQPENDAAARVETLNLGQKIVRVAREQIGRPYARGGNGPDTFDDIGFIRYCYSAVGVDIPDYRVEDYEEKYLKVEAKRISSLGSAAAGDLLVYVHSISIGGGQTMSIADTIAISNGEGGGIFASYPPGKTKVGEFVEEVPDLSSVSPLPNTVYRIVPDAQTSQGALPTIDISASTYWSFASNDPYSSVVAENLSKVQSEGYKEGYLIDMTHGGFFKFYVPEFEESAGANWSSIDIIGRSVPVVAYNHTSARTIQVSLDLYAGVGMYGVSEDPVGKLHADANFLKSLEYPDYTNPITRPPSTVHIILGSAFNLVGVVSNVNINHLKPVDDQNRSMYLKVSFKVTQIAVNPPDYTDIYHNQYVKIGTDDINSLSAGSVDTNTPVYSES